jgi:uncharacterized protein with PIN domain
MMMAPRFAAEKTLGKLAKWLRILGFDTVYEPDFPNRSLADFADTGRIILTRTQRIRAENASSKLVFIKSDRPFEQLQHVMHTLELDQTDTRPFSRCLKCNELITPVDKASVRHSVPDYIWETQNSFRICNRCRKIYWPGSHIKRSKNIINKLFDV